MPEQQNTEYKSIWKDEYLKWICGFANAQGGRIYIGMNDAATVVGLPDQKTLMEEIPNKIKNNMGITSVVFGRKKKSPIFPCPIIGIKERAGLIFSNHHRFL